MTKIHLSKSTPSDSTEWQTNILISRDAPYYVVWCVWKCTWSPNYLPSYYTNTAVELAGWKGLSTPYFKANPPYFTGDAPYFMPSKLTSNHQNHWLPCKSTSNDRNYKENFWRNNCEHSIEDSKCTFHPASSTAVLV